MTPSHKLEIICYLAWQGAEATFQIRDDLRFEMVKVALAKFAVPMYRDGQRQPTDMYVIDDQSRAEFEQIIRKFAN